MGDLLGYYQTPVMGRVDADGTLSDGSGVTSVTKSGSYVGDYYVYIDRTLGPGCAPAITVEDANIRGFGYVCSTYLYVDLRNYISTAEPRRDLRIRRPVQMKQ